MRVLLSAYSCEPGLGSESAVGWGWATALAKRHDVCVLTRESNRQRIESFRIDGASLNLRFLYYDLPGVLRVAKKWLPGGVIIYYLLWQLGAYRYIKGRIKNGESFDVVHHVTFVSARFPSFMGRLGLPFVFGPVAGGEYSPATLWWGLGWKARCLETIRYISSLWISFSPIMRDTFGSASRILATSQQTAMLIPARDRSKVSVMMGIALPESSVSSGDDVTEKNNVASELRLFYAGRFLYWKGMELGLHAFARFLKTGREGSLTLYGDGPEGERWRQLAERLGIADRVVWRPVTERAKLMSAMEGYDALLFPSLHDSGGMVVLEAMSKGVPVICLDVGGPAVMVRHGETGFKASIDSRESTINGLYVAMTEMADNPVRRRRMGAAARELVCQEFLWEGRVDRIEDVYRSAMTTRRVSAE